MDNHEALKILTEHNQWRRGMTDEYSFGADNIGEAIDTAISVLSRAHRHGSIKPIPSIPSHYGNSVAGDSSLPAPTQDGTAEEVLQELLDIEYPDDPQYANLESALISRKYCIQAMYNYAAPLRAEIQKLNESKDMAVHEREVMMQSFKDIREAFESREWITQGRGSYKYNDDRYMEEAKYLFADFKKIESEMWKQITSKSYEYRKSIEQPLRAEIERLKSELAASVSPKLVMPDIRGRNDPDYADRAWNECMATILRLNPHLNQ